MENNGIKPDFDFSVINQEVQDKLKKVNEGQSISLNEVEGQDIQWIWKNRIPKGKFMLIAGLQGTGKSILGMDIAARISKGKKWPDEASNEVGDIILMDGEDGIKETIKPRSEAAGANFDKIHVLKTIEKPDPETEEIESKTPDLVQDRHEIEKEIAAKRPAIIILDPLNAFIDNADGNSDQVMRSKVFSPLSQLADQYKVTILGIMHPNKSTSQIALHRVVGSISYTAAARTAYLLTTDKDDKNRLLFLELKNNLSEKMSGLAFSINTKSMEGYTENFPYVEWENEPVDISPDEALQGTTTNKKERQIAVEFLQQRLEGEIVQAKEIYDEGKDYEISPRTLERAKDDIGATSKRIGKTWYWGYPEKLEEAKEVFDKNKIANS